MRPLRSWLVYLIGVLGVGALAAPWVYALMQRLAAEWPVFETLADHPFRRYVSRCLMVLALAGLWPLLRSLGIRRWGDIGFDRDRRMIGDVAWGFAVGASLLAAVVLLGVGLNLREFAPKDSALAVAAVLAGGLLTAAVVAVLEETLFRGALFSSVRRVHGWWLAMGFSTVVHAVSHFLARLHWDGPVGWAAGLGVLGRSLQALVEVDGFLPEFLMLLAAGFVLAAARERSGALWLPIGLHAGWILGRKLADGFTELVAPAGVFGENLLFAVMLLLTAGWVWHRHRTDMAKGDDARDEPGE